MVRADHDAEVPEVRAKAVGRNRDAVARLEGVAGDERELVSIGYGGEEVDTPRVSVLLPTFNDWEGSLLGKDALDLHLPQILWWGKQRAVCWLMV